MIQLFSFNGGVKPPTHKHESTQEPIADFIAEAGWPAELVFPLQQGKGGTPHALVAIGDHVLKGQRIGDADSSLATAVHASTSGTVTAIEMRTPPHASGLAVLCVVIAPDGRDTWLTPEPFDYRSATPDQLRNHLRDAGIVGLGGAAFPSYLKLQPGGDSRIDTLIINGAECEPFITCDDMLMREHAASILGGALIMRDILQARRIQVGIEDNKPEAIAAMRAAAAGKDEIEVVAVPTRYPAGGEKQLIRVLTGIEVPRGKRPSEYGVQCFNVGTAYAIFEALTLGRPLVSRVITVAGNVAAPRNYLTPLGVSMRSLAEHAGARADTDRIIMGGPMMGVTMPAMDVPVVKATNCVLAGSKTLFPPPPPEMPCIRCGECAKACPADLQPFELYWYSKAKIFGKAQEYHLFDCIECGCCSYVCPSHIPLVDYYRFAKSEIWAREKEKEAADIARERYEFRIAREEREKQEKAAKLAARAAAAKPKPSADASAPVAAGNAPQPSTPAAAAPSPAGADAADAKKALIAAAIERAKQQKAAALPKNTETLTPEQQAEVAEIEARRAQIKEMAKPHVPTDN